MKKIKKAIDSPRPVFKPPFLKQGKELIFTLKLDHIANPLDPDHLWNYGGEVILDDDADTPAAAKLKTGLKDALNHHQKTSFTYREGHEFPVPDLAVFTDVVVWIAESLWNAQDLCGNHNLFIMSEKLKHLHAKDLQGRLYQDRAPRYAIMPHADLGERQVICQFGLGVFVPDDIDRQTAELEIVSGAQAYPLPGWWLMKVDPDQKQVQKIYRPAGYYEKQYSLLIGPQLADAAIHPPVWFVHNEGYVLIDTHRQPEKAQGDGLVVNTQVKATREADGTTCCEFSAKDQPSQTLVLRIKPLNKQTVANSSNSAEPAKHESVAESKDTFAGDLDAAVPRPYDPLSGYTFVDYGREAAPTLCAALHLVALALPNCRSLPRNNRYWLMSFDDNGMPASADEDVVWQLRGDTSGHLDWKKRDDHVWHHQSTPIKAQVPLPLSARLPILLEPAPTRDFLGLYRLPVPMAIAGLEDKIYTLGRQGDIRLQLLARSDSLQGGAPGDTLNNYGVSGLHVSMAARDGSLRLTQQSKSVQTWVQTAAHGLQVFAANADDTADLAPGDRFIVGCYVLQFNEVNG